MNQTRQYVQATAALKLPDLCKACKTDASKHLELEHVKSIQYLLSFKKNVYESMY